MSCSNSLPEQFWVQHKDSATEPPRRNNQSNCIKNLQHLTFSKINHLDIRTPVPPGIIPRAVHPRVWDHEHADIVTQLQRQGKTVDLGDLGDLGKALIFSSTSLRNPQKPVCHRNKRDLRLARGTLRLSLGSPWGSGERGREGRSFSPASRQGLEQTDSTGNSRIWSVPATPAATPLN